MNSGSSIEDLESKLSELDAERARLILEINTLRNNERTNPERPKPKLLGIQILDTPPITPEEKVSLFLKLFRCREDVFPKRWDNSKTGKQGYSPSCANEWVKPICEKPRIKCSDCKFQKFHSLNEHQVELHLKGVLTVGTYAINTDDSCRFLSCDFDEANWKEDVLAYKQAARELGIEAYIERSRSGNGAHAWIFFNERVPARIARSLGTLILAKCSELNIRLSLDSYDRFFPSQDYLPIGGFGNLIALPLQKIPRSLGNSCFLNDELMPHPDQWAYLSQVRTLKLNEIKSVVDQYIPKIDFSLRKDAFDDISWITDQTILEKTTSDKIDYSLEGKNIEITFGPMLSIPLEFLSGKIVAKLKKTASFPNPEFYRRQRARRATYPEPRFIFSGEMRPNEIVLPRGSIDQAVKILTIAGAKIVIRDERIGKRKIKVTFTGELTDTQKTAIRSWKSNDFGILVAPPGAGKTVMGCAVIAQRKVSTLILVHRQQILDQWKSTIAKFLGIPPKEIGNLSGSKKKMTGRIDLAMLQTLGNVEDLSEIAQNYSQIIIDECHHIPATTFEDILKQLPARYILGLTATPYRKDGLEKILFQQCGSIRHEVKSVDDGKLSKLATIHETGFRISPNDGEFPPYHVLLHALTNDEKRNAKIAQLTIGALHEGRFPLLISDRKDHLDLLTAIIEKDGSTGILKTIRLDGGMSNKQRRLAMEQIKQSQEEKAPTLIVATASLIGEGFDLPELDTLILATPLSFEGRIIQYAGRLHRLSEGKTNAKIIDFVDSSSAMLLKMYKNRTKAYKKMGYMVQEPSGHHGSRGMRGTPLHDTTLEFDLEK